MCPNIFFATQPNEESRRLQYAMRERLEQPGWEQIEVTDEDLGRSAAGNVERRGFERILPFGLAAGPHDNFTQIDRRWIALRGFVRLITNRASAEQNTNCDFEVEIGFGTINKGCLHYSGFHLNE